MTTDEKKGAIITFYSYKGGTGRTMAVANVATLLAIQENKKVLIIDWDLEAPGLHTYFEDYLGGETDNMPGLIDLFVTLDKSPADKTKNVIEDNFPDYLIKVNGLQSGDIFILKAGRFDESYTEKVQTFDWRNFYQKKYDFFQFWISYLEANFDFILIDSRTGLTDISGICTMILPERIVTVFTPNRQSLDNLLHIMSSWVDYRLNSPDFRPYMIYPLPSRVELNELDLYKEWQEKYISGFENKFRSVYKLKYCKLKSYFDLVALSYIPKYAYGEKISVLSDGLSEAENPKLNVKQYAELIKAIISNENLWDYSYYATKGYKEAMERIHRAIDEGSKELSLSGLSLHEIPEELFLLKDLEFLDLSINKLEEITNLSELPLLKSLDLSDNQITEIDGLDGLSKLQTLLLNNNNISGIKGLNNLSSLEELNLSHNQINSIESSGIKKNVFLLIGGNKIRWITKDDYVSYFYNPVVIKNPSTRNYDAISLESQLLPNPLVSLPAELIKQGRDVILRYLTELEHSGTEYLYEAKLLIVGQPRAGKTTLLRKLFDSEAAPPQEDETTRGIDIQRLQFDVKDAVGEVRKFRYNLWDFGGQQIYQATHQFFLTRRSLYVLVVDTSRDSIGSDESTLNYWLQTIELLGGNSPVLVVKNEKDGRPVNIDLISKRARFSFLKGDYAVDLGALLPDSPKYNREKEKNFERLKEDIQNELLHLPLAGFAVPANWLRIREDLQELGVKKPYISRQEYIHLCEKFGIYEFDKQMELSSVFHDLGVFLHFREYTLLEDLIILDYTWVTNAVFAVLDNNLVQSQSGRFTGADLPEIWEGRGYKEEVHRRLLSLMMQFEICYALKGEKETSYIVPDMLPIVPPKNYFWQDHNDLHLQYRYDFMPKGLMTRLTIRLGNCIFQQDGEQVVWKTGVCIDGRALSCPETIAEITEAWDNKSLYVRTRGSFPKELMNVLMRELDALNTEYFRSTSDGERQISRWHKMIPCNCATCSSGPDKHFHDYERLLKAREMGRTIQCQLSFDDMNVQSVLNDIFPTDDKPKRLPGPPRLFISYSKKDLPYVNNFFTHLSALVHDGKLAYWSGEELTVTSNQDEEVRRWFDESDMVCFMISLSFINSAIGRRRVKMAFDKKAVDPDFRIIPIILDYCLWKTGHRELGHLTALPYFERPVASFKNQDEAWQFVLECLKLIIGNGLNPQGDDFFASQPMSLEMTKIFKRIKEGKTTD